MFLGEALNGEREVEESLYRAASYQLLRLWKLKGAAFSSFSRHHAPIITSEKTYFMTAVLQAHLISCSISQKAGWLWNMLAEQVAKAAFFGLQNTGVDNYLGKHFTTFIPCIFSLF